MKKCPTCDVVMNEVTKAGVWIDVCPKCVGIWLDKGELEKIISHSETNEVEYYNNYKRDGHDNHDDTQDHYDGHHDKHHDRYSGKVYYDEHGRPMRRRGGLGEIFGNLFD